jgi:choice-of-anchor C domain-containing protein
VDRRHFIQVAGAAMLSTTLGTQVVCAANKQRGWRHCKKCQGLFWGLGHCPAGETHSLENPIVYVLTANDPNAPGQQKWRYCSKCQTLWYGGSHAKSKCPEGGMHNEPGSWDYVLPTRGDGQKNWFRCGKCQGLFYGGDKGTGICPVGGGHTKAESGSEYRLDHEPFYKRSVTGKAVAGFDALDAIMEKYLQKIGCTAASLTITRSHQDTPYGMQPTPDVTPLFSRGYGWCDLEQKTPMQPDTPMAIASCDKPFTAAMIRQMVLDGKLSLDDSVFKVLKIKAAGEVIDKRVWDIKVIHLLEHKAGWQGEALAKADQAYRTAGGKDMDDIGMAPWLKKQLELVMTQRLSWTPGEKEAYDNFGFATMKLMVHRLSGQSECDYLRNQLCRPFGVEELKWVRQGGPIRVGEPPRLWNGLSGAKKDPLSNGLSTPAMCTFMRFFWIDGRPRDNRNPGWVMGGSWDNSSSSMNWRSDGINVACVFNGRREIDGDLGKELAEAIDQLVKKKKLPPVPRPPANLLVNGSFEQGPHIDQFVALDPGSTAVRGWKVTRGQIIWQGTLCKAQDGGRSLDLHGEHGHGGIEQSFKTTIGQRYRVTFAMAGNPDGSVPVKRLAVRAAGKKQEFAFDTTGRKSDNMGWVEYAWAFDAVTEQTTVEFHTVMAADPCCGPALDNVRVWPVPAKK